MKEVNILELHYWLKNQSHSMNALIQNKSEFEFLSIVTEIGKTFEIDLIIETEPIAEGGIRRWFKLVSKNEKKNQAISIGVVSALVISVVVTPLNTAITKTVEILIENILEDEVDKEIKKEELEGKRLDNEEKRLRIKKLKSEIYGKVDTIQTNYKIQKRRSNFYEELEKEKSIEKLSFIIENSEKEPLFNEFKVDKHNFKNYILVSDKVDTDPIENAVIEIISPVLKKGDYKWKGYYNDEAISFNMKSAEFKTLVQTGKIEFKNGSSIDCVLDIEKRIDNEGNEKIINYNILRVNNYFENDKPIETPEGKIHRQKKEADDSQFKMFDEII